MRKEAAWILILLILPLAGCAAVVAGGAAVTAGTGTYLYVNGEMRTDYPNGFDEVWKACEKMVASMRGVDVVPAKEISEGTIEATIDGERVRILVKYKAMKATTVAIRVGLIGNEQSSQFLHDRILEFLTRSS
jgi:hypothetical protein